MLVFLAVAFHALHERLGRGRRSHPLHNLKWPVLYSFFSCFVLIFLLPVPLQALHERLGIGPAFSSSPQLEVARFVFIFPLFCAYFSSSSFSRFARAFRHGAGVLILSTTWNGPFCIHFSSVLFLFFFFQQLYTLCTSVFHVYTFHSRCRRLHNLKWPVFCTHFSCVLHLFFFC